MSALNCCEGCGRDTAGRYCYTCLGRSSTKNAKQRGEKGRTMSLPREIGEALDEGEQDNDSGWPYSDYDRINGERTRERR